eukprot:5744090-Pleurochrysis_carterae.AAC.1
MEFCCNFFLIAVCALLLFALFPFWTFALEVTKRHSRTGAKADSALSPCERTYATHLRFQSSLRAARIDALD